MKRSKLLWLMLLGLVAVTVSAFVFIRWSPGKENLTSRSLQDTTVNPGKADSNSAGNSTLEPFDTAAYDQKMLQITNGDTSGRWPVKAPYPLPGAILPFKRVIAYYGNLYSKQMGILGELPEKEMLDRLMGEVKKWEEADSLTPVQPALHYIAVTAQQAPGAGGKYRLRMPFNQIDKVLAMAEKINAIVFLDIQVGLSNLETEVPQLEKYLKMPNVHLGVDPEFSMKTGHAPGKVVGTFDAADINYTIDYLSKLVRENNLPPKILVIHRFTGPMVTNSSQIKPQPEVQVVMHMDGWGEAERKIGTYKRYIYPQPVQFTGFKIFYKNDTKKVNRTEVMQPGQLLKLKPQPIYIQYQ
ncbi:MAG TPA: hypothetical protein VD993_07495 [Chitinophagaceae bacterium]|nr:hypothetical protein [Chitinophagaceae bacterium]